MKARCVFICISLDRVIIPGTMPGPQRMFVHCLPSIDLELRFVGTIFCEMGDLDQTPPQQTLVHLIVLE